eukprot:RCo005462
MFGVLSVRWALVLWRRCYVELCEAEGMLRIAASPTSRSADLIPLGEVEVRVRSSRRFSLVPRGSGRSYHLCTDTPLQCAEWTLAILALQKGLASPLSSGSPPVVRFCETTASLPLVTRKPLVYLWPLPISRPQPSLSTRGSSSPDTCNSSSSSSVGERDPLEGPQPRMRPGLVPFTSCVTLSSCKRPIPSAEGSERR